MIRSICVVLLVAAVVAQNKPHYNLQDAPALFEKFIRDYHRVYKDEADKQLHYKAFVHSLKMINKYNAENSAVFDINNLADYTQEEFHGLLGLRPALGNHLKTGKTESH